MLGKQSEIESLMREILANDYLDLSVDSYSVQEDAQTGECPSAALLFVSLLLERWARRRSALSRDAILGVAIACAVYVRTANLVLLVAIPLSRLVSRVGADPVEDPEPWSRRGLRLAVLVGVIIDGSSGTSTGSSSPSQPKINP